MLTGDQTAGVQDPNLIRDRFDNFHIAFFTIKSLAVCKVEQIRPIYFLPKDLEYPRRESQFRLHSFGFIPFYFSVVLRN